MADGDGCVRKQDSTVVDHGIGRALVQVLEMPHEILCGGLFLLQVIQHDGYVLGIGRQFRADEFQGRTHVLLVLGPVDDPLDGKSDHNTQDDREDVEEEIGRGFFHAKGKGRSLSAKNQIFRKYCLNLFSVNYDICPE